ncbi:hypothetical protein [Streptomyces sp. NBC_01750]|nr:hypothetical protein [Streptomyces sp. NBC_01750]WSD36193.1 hypothetical protein OG966_32385 [Streptomyces sp. NBC_01750]
MAEREEGEDRGRGLVRVVEEAFQRGGLGPRRASPRTPRATPRS